MNTGTRFLSKQMDWKDYSLINVQGSVNMNTGTRFLWGFERAYIAYKAWVRLLKGQSGVEPFYIYLQPYSWDR